jgi:VIT1/CCC1 family predicted Fe2+/Mn2+ transporter
MSEKNKAGKKHVMGNMQKAQRRRVRRHVATKHWHWHEVSRGRYLGDAIYGASDGIVTTFSIVAGATGALLSSTVILILGFINLIANGFSMAAGNYLGTKSEIDFYKKEREREINEIQNLPDDEREEVRQILGIRGLVPNLADELAELITSNRNLWIDFMMTEELGAAPTMDVSAWKSALATLSAFIAAGFAPLIFFVV